MANRVRIAEERESGRRKGLPGRGERVSGSGKGLMARVGGESGAAKGDRGGWLVRGVSRTGPARTGPAGTNALAWTSWHGCVLPRVDARGAGSSVTTRHGSRPGAGEASYSGDDLQWAAPTARSSPTPLYRREQVAESRSAGGNAQTLKLW